MFAHFLSLLHHIPFTRGSLQMLVHSSSRADLFSHHMFVCSLLFRRWAGVPSSTRTSLRSSRSGPKRRAGCCSGAFFDALLGRIAKKRGICIYFLGFAGPEDFLYAPGPKRVVVEITIKIAAVEITSNYSFL